VLEEQSENELCLAELLKEEKVLNARRQLKLDQRKEALKLETKRQFAVMNIENRLVESDIQAFSLATTSMQQLRSNVRRTAPDAVPASPENRQQLFARLAEVRRDIAMLDEKLRSRLTLDKRQVNRDNFLSWTRKLLKKWAWDRVFTRPEYLRKAWKKTVDDRLLTASECFRVAFKSSIMGIDNNRNQMEADLKKPISIVSTKSSIRHETLNSLD
jgi:hypothetical protein